jgi:hypothetical protein
MYGGGTCFGIKNLQAEQRTGMDKPISGLPTTTTAMTQNRLRRMIEANPDGVRGYEWVLPYELAEEEKLSMDQVERMLRRCTNKTRDECLADPQIKVFAERTHPRIFNAFMAGGEKLSMLRRLIDTARRIEKNPRREREEIKKLQKQFLRPQRRGKKKKSKKNK